MVYVVVVNLEGGSMTGKDLGRRPGVVAMLEELCNEDSLTFVLTDVLALDPSGPVGGPGRWRRHGQPTEEEGTSPASRKVDARGGSLRESSHPGIQSRLVAAYRWHYASHVPQQVAQLRPHAHLEEVCWKQLYWKAGLSEKGS